MLRYWFSVKIINLNLKIHFLLRCFNYSADNHDFMREYWEISTPQPYDFDWTFFYWNNGFTLEEEIDKNPCLILDKWILDLQYDSPIFFSQNAKSPWHKIFNLREVRVVSEKKMNQKYLHDGGRSLNILWCKCLHWTEDL